ncbi:hypothetical protein MASR2M78_08150 [Treponema sp.]
MENVNLISPDNPYRRLFIDSSVALAFLDENGFIVDCNENFKLIFASLAGRSIEELDEPFPEFLRTRDAFRFSYHFSRLIAGAARSVSFETAFRTSNGSSRWLKMRAWAIPIVSYFVCRGP